MHAVIETSQFSRRADALLTREERRALIDHLAANPRAGVVIPGTGGVRKFRFAADGRGKSGGFRVIHFLASDDTPIVALMIYGKNEQVDPNPAQRRAMAALVDAMKKAVGHVASMEDEDGCD